MKTIEWGYLIILYLFLGGLSAGLYFVSSVAMFLQNGDARHKRIARWGALLAPWPVALGSALLIFDLGNWYRFYKLFLHFKWLSPMSIGAWLLMLFTLASLLYCYAWLQENERAWLFAKLPRRFRFLQSLNVDLDMYRRAIAVAGVPLAVGVGIYTGVLLGAVQARPFWNTNLVAQLFLFSALSTGCAALMFAFAFSKKPLSGEELRLLYWLDICFLTLEFFIVLPYLVHGQLSVEAVRESMKLILGGPFTLLFWVFFLWFGLLLPLGIEVGEMMPPLLSKTTPHVRKWLVGTTAVLILSGGFLLRYIFVFAGQISAFK
jgi:formate-dependent nitrite reductase membrane component NrfD